MTPRGAEWQGGVPAKLNNGANIASNNPIFNQSENSAFKRGSPRVMID